MKHVERAVELSARSHLRMLTQIMQRFRDLLAMVADHLEAETGALGMQGESTALLGTQLRRIVKDGLSPVVADLEALTSEPGRKRKPRKRRS